MSRITSLVLEDRAGQWPIAVDWIACLRPCRFEHEGRTFDAAGQRTDGTWIYRTAQDAPKTPAQQGRTVRLERGVARCFVTDLVVAPPLPDTIDYQDATYRKKGEAVYWHG